MKPFMLILSPAFLLLINCKKDSTNEIKPNEMKPAIIKADSSQGEIPYYLRYRIYKKDFNSLYSNYLKFGKNEGC
ncbi:MAG: hypothetical protein K0S53_684 [Bacteroidetes bacterium]|jgi:hypothetical protein|nr:hypothetical protein [Bacteroidota bacterium]MDF2452433.1 hypothetical protein [Bacteroidota bacterium]